MTDSYGIREGCTLCGKPVHALGLCNTHYRRSKRQTIPMDAFVASWDRSLGQRLLDGIEYDPNGGCWLWFKSTHQFGYGRVGRRLAHNLAWELWRGPIPAGLFVLHRCDVPQCVNPDHLFLGTRGDNNADMRAKGRHAFGERNGHAKLSEADAKRIKVRLSKGEIHAVIAADYGVSRETITMIRRGKNWSHV